MVTPTEIVKSIACTLLEQIVRNKFITTVITQLTMFERATVSAQAHLPI